MKISSSRRDYDSRLEMTLVIRALLCADYTPGFMQIAAFKVVLPPSHQLLLLSPPQIQAQCLRPLAGSFITRAPQREVLFTQWREWNDRDRARALFQSQFMILIYYNERIHLSANSGAASLGELEVPMCSSREWLQWLTAILSFYLTSYMH